MFLEDFEVQYCDFYNKEIVCSGCCSSCKLQKIANAIFEDFDLDLEDSDLDLEDSDLDLEDFDSDLEDSDSDLYLV